MTEEIKTPFIQDDMIISSRVRLARNLTQFPFQMKMKAEDKQNLIKTVRSALEKIDMKDNPFVYITIADIDKIRAYSLLEQHLISPDLLHDSRNGFVALSKDRSISIMLNEEDHIRIQVLRNDFQLDKALETANAIDNELDKNLDYAFDEKLGFLTTCPTNLGTGMRASFMLHLPMLTKAGVMSNLISTIGKLGLTIRGSYGEGTTAVGAMYTISNQITLGITEQQSITNLQSVVQEIMIQEKDVRKNAMSKKEDFEDKIFRSLGILQNARILKSNEFFSLISNIMLGIGEGYFMSLPIDEIQKLQKSIGSAVICENANKDLSPHERDIIRAQMVRDTLNKYLPQKRTGQ